METLIISKKLAGEKELVLIPRRHYEEMVHAFSRVKKILAEEADTDEAIRIYKKEGKAGKLYTIKSLLDFISKSGNKSCQLPATRGRLGPGGLPPGH